MKRSIRQRMDTPEAGEPAQPPGRGGLFTWRQVQMVRTLLRAGYTRRQVGEAFMVPTSTIAAIENGRAYRWVPERNGVE